MDLDGLAIDPRLGRRIVTLDVGCLKVVKCIAVHFQALGSSRLEVDSCLVKVRLKPIEDGAGSRSIRFLVNRALNPAQATLCKQGLICRLCTEDNVLCTRENDTDIR